MAPTIQDSPAFRWPESLGSARFPGAGARYGARRPSARKNVK